MRFLAFVALSLCSSFAHANPNSGEATPRKTPARIVAIGDSIVWGQGLTTAAKFVNIVADRFVQIAGRSAKLENYAHSGATLLDDASDSLKVLADVNGEVPRPSNSIRHQVSAVPDPRSVDVLILDGCINDVGANSIVLLPAKTATQSYWRARANDKCRGPMKAFLVDALAKFPNAKIVVTGYYPLFLSDKKSRSSKSLVDSVASWLDDKLDGISDSLLGKALDGLCGDDASCAKVSLDELRNGLVKKSNWWFEESSRALREAVDEVNSTSKGRRVSFAAIAFDTGDGAWQSHAKLWNPGQIDSRSSERVSQCQRARQMAPKLNYKRCVAAAAFHPNTHGAKLYADAVEKSLRSLLK